MKILIFGPQGVGKRTQAAMLAARWRIPHISAGDLFRDNIERNTHLGDQARTALKIGELGSAVTTEAVVADRLNEDDVQDGFLLDGFPPKHRAS